MKRSMFVLLSLLAIAALSACAPKGTPTPSVAELQTTAMANAQTQIALTAAAIPTATPLPPTAMPTPIPVLPTEIIQQPIATLPVEPTDIPGDASLSSDNPCNGPLSKMKGPHVQVTFNNATQGNVSLYLYIYKTAFGCGVGDVTLAPNASVTTNVPKGCYDFYGWISGPKDSTPAGYGCLNFDQTVNVRRDDLVFKDQINASSQSSDGGIKGTMTIGPMCSVVQTDASCPDQTFQATFFVLSATGVKVTEFKSDKLGRFQISLASGDYLLHLHAPQLAQVAADIPFNVAGNQYTLLNIKYDSGIR
jgi:hypothetical protein